MKSKVSCQVTAYGSWVMAVSSGRRWLVGPVRNGPLLPHRYGSTPRYGRASSSAASAPSPRASRSSCSYLHSSLAQSLTSALSSGSHCWPMCAPSPPTRYLGVRVELSEQEGSGRVAFRLWSAERCLCLHLASTHPQLHHDHSGGQWQAGARSQGSTFRAPGRGEGNVAHLPVFLAPRGPIIKPTVCQDFVPTKGEWLPIPHSFVPGWRVCVCSLVSAAPSALLPLP